MAGAGLSLNVPLKTSSECDYSSPLTSQFRKSPELDTAVTELNKLRNTFISKHAAKSESTLESLYRYYDQLVILTKKLPESAQTGFLFTWEDALEKGSRFGGGKSNNSSSSIDFEKCCVLFNIAALQSQLGSECSDTDEELKTAAKYFQSSAGIFSELSAQKIHQMIPGDQTLTSDLSADTLSALSALMLAQAQEMFVTKAIKGSMKDAIIAKLSVQAVDLYADALRKMTKDSVKHIWDKTWLPNVAGKQTGYDALANFFQSKVCDVNKRIGEQISRLNFCLENLRKAQERTGNTDFLTYYVNEGTRIKTEAQKDNDFIYHEPVPDSANLQTIDRVPSARLAKLLPIPESFSSSCGDLFEKCTLASSPPPVKAQTSPNTPLASNTPMPDVIQQVQPPPPVSPTQNIGSPTQPKDTPASPAQSSSSNVADPDSPSLSEILNTSVNAVGNYLHNYLLGKKRHQ